MKETILMIHGMWCGEWCWEKYKFFFEHNGYRCITPTLRHHGIQPFAEPDAQLGTCSLLDYVRDLEREIDRMDKMPILMGHSMGGLLAQILGSRKPVKALILLTLQRDLLIMSKVLYTFSPVGQIGAMVSFLNPKDLFDQAFNGMFFHR